MVPAHLEIDLCALLLGLSIWSWLIGGFNCGRRSEGKPSTAVGRLFCNYGRKYLFL